MPPFELTTHRVLWCALFVAIVTAWRGRLAHIVTILRTPKLLGTLALTSILITTNWTVFIYCVATNRLVEASLGYYLTPLLSIALGVFLFGEHMTRLRLAGVILAAIAVVDQGGLAWPCAVDRAFRWRCRSASTASSARRRRSIPWTGS